MVEGRLTLTERGTFSPNHFFFWISKCGHEAFRYLLGSTLAGDNAAAFGIVYDSFRLAIGTHLA